MTVAQLQQEFLTSNEKHLAPEDFFILLAHATEKEKVFLLAHPEYDLSKADEALVRAFFKRRLRCESVASIIGHKEFYGYDFRVTEDTLIPRPETELLVELALNRIRNPSVAKTLAGRHESGIGNRGKIVFIDVGTGSGNIIISIASELRKSHSQFTLFATDISEKALIIAKENAETHNVDQTITFLHGDLLAPYTERYFRPDTHLILAANLPYLSEEIYRAADDDVKKFEPRSALVSGQEGLDHYCRLLEEVRNIRTKLSSITLFLEISPEQTLVLKKHIILLFPVAIIIIHKDLAKKDRVVEICL